MYRFLLLIGLILPVGCSQWYVRTEIRAFQKAAVRIPNDMEVIQNGKLLDSVTPVQSYKIKFVIYYSSKGCASCNINHLNDLDTLFSLKRDGLFSPVVIFAPEAQKYKELLQNLRVQAYSFPICIDKSNEFQQFNKNLPADTRFHSFYWIKRIMLF